MLHVASLATSVLLVAGTLMGCSSSSDDSEADPPESTSSSEATPSSQTSETAATPEQPEVPELDGTYVGDILVTKGTFEDFAKGQRSKNVAFLVSCADVKCSTADLRLDVATTSSFASTMALTRKGETLTGDATRTSPCPSGQGNATSATSWTFTSATGDRIDGTFKLVFKGCDTPGTATAKVTAVQTVQTASYLDAEAGTAFVTAFAAYDDALAVVYDKYNACGERTGRAFASCVIALYEPWNAALNEFTDPVDQASETATGICRARLEELDLTGLEKRQRQAIAALKKLKSGGSPKENERLITRALDQHETLIRAVLMCVSPTDTAPAVPPDGFALDLNDLALDT